MAEKQVAPPSPLPLVMAAPPPSPYEQIQAMESHVSPPPPPISMAVTPSPFGHLYPAATEEGLNQAHLPLPPPRRMWLEAPSWLYYPPRKASLYVGDLHPETTETELIKVFAEIGYLASVHLCKNKFTQKSLCYAYVNFYHPFHASKAMEILNHTELRGKPMRIMWCQRDPLIRKTSIANLFVKNLDPSVSAAQLESLFSKFGTILSCKLAEENGKTKGFGFVQFDSENSAMEAINALNGAIFSGQNLYVTKFVRRNFSLDEFARARFTNLYVKNLDEQLTDTLLEEKFSEFGKVSSAVIMKNDDGKPRGFGFVNFVTHENAVKAMTALNGTLIGSKIVYVGRAQKRSERKALLYLERIHREKLKLFAKNLDLSIDNARLKSIFSDSGKVISAKVIRHEDGTSKGCATLTFSTPAEADKALTTHNGKLIEAKPPLHPLSMEGKKVTRKQDFKENFHASFTASSCIQGGKGIQALFKANIQTN